MAHPPEQQGKRPVFVRQDRDGNWQIFVHVQPGAKRSELAGVLGDRLKIRLAAPAVDNKANTALAEFLAKKIGLRPAKVVLSAGQTSRQKTLTIYTEKEPLWLALLC